MRPMRVPGEACPAQRFSYQVGTGIFLVCWWYAGDTLLTSTYHAYPSSGWFAGPGMVRILILLRAARSMACS